MDRVILSITVAVRYVDAMHTIQDWRKQRESNPQRHGRSRFQIDVLVHSDYFLKNGRVGQIRTGERFAPNEVGIASAPTTL